MDTENEGPGLDLPFDWHDWPFEFNPATKPDEATYFKFGYQLGSRVPHSPDRNPGGYGPYAKFVKDRSIRDTVIHRDQLAEERAQISRLVRRWEALRADAKKELARAEHAVHNEEGRLYLYASIRDTPIADVVTGLPVEKKTMDTLKHYSRSHPCYYECKMWAAHAQAQHDYIDGVYKNLVHIKSKMLMSLASDEREERRMDHVDTTINE